MTPSTTIRELLTEAEVATRLRLNPDCVRKLVSARQLTPIPICGEVRYDSLDVVSLIATYKAVALRRNTDV